MNVMMRTTEMTSQRTVCDKPKVRGPSFYEPDHSARVEHPVVVNSLRNKA